MIITDRVPIRSIVSGEHYVTFLAEELRSEIREWQLRMLPHGVSISHDNAWLRIRAPVVALLQKYGWERLENPPNSPDLSPMGFDLFPKPNENHLEQSDFPA